MWVDSVPRLSVMRYRPRLRKLDHERQKTSNSATLLRHILHLGRRFGVAVCTEVVEHVEPLIASQIIMTLMLHADIIWFSFKPSADKINHPNERPLKIWKNLFDFYGYDVVMIPWKVYEPCSHRGNLVAYRRDIVESDRTRL
jgi:hypothetical protein